MSLGSYKRVHESTETPRQTEIRVLRAINYALRHSVENQDRIGLMKAALNNRMVWQVFLDDVQHQDNKLPRDLRRSIVIASRSIIQEIDDNIQAELDVDFLLTMNENVIQGLIAGAAAEAQLASGIAPATTP